MTAIGSDIGLYEKLLALTSTILLANRKRQSDSQAAATCELKVISSRSSRLQKATELQAGPRHCAQTLEPLCNMLIDNMEPGTDMLEPEQLEAFQAAAELPDTLEKIWPEGQEWPNDVPVPTDVTNPQPLLPWSDLAVDRQFHLNPNLAVPVPGCSDPPFWPPFDLTDFGDIGNTMLSEPANPADINQFIDFQALPGQDNVNDLQPFVPPLDNISVMWPNLTNESFVGGSMISSDTSTATGSPATSVSREQSTESEVSNTFLDQELKRTKSDSPFDEPENRFTSEQERWQATVSRLRAADRHFLYGVRTTKIFCRPSCASRRAGKQHVQFFPFPNAIEAARNAGFRPCKRCMPEQQGIIDKGSKGVVKALTAIIRDAFEPINNKSATSDLKLDDLAKAADLSPFHFQRTFKAATQITPGDFSTACKSLSLQDALAKQLCTCFDFPTAMDPETMCSACKIMEQCSRWTDRTAKKALGGVRPSEYANGMPNSTVQYVTVPAPPGRLYVTFSGAGSVHSVLIGDDALPKTLLRFANLQEAGNITTKLEQAILDMHELSKDRDSEIPKKQLHVLWRARIWLLIVRDRLLST